MASEWATWQLLDSLLPTGGFAHSYGLEAALQAGLLGPPGRDREGRHGLQRFIIGALENAGTFFLPFVAATHTAFEEQGRAPSSTPMNADGSGRYVAPAESAAQCGDQEQEAQGERTPIVISTTSPGEEPGAAAHPLGHPLGGGLLDGVASPVGMASRGGAPSGEAAPSDRFGRGWSRPVQLWAGCDAVLHAMLSNHVASRASIAQGSALLRVATAIFPDAPLLQELKARMRSPKEEGRSFGGPSGPGCRLSEGAGRSAQQPPGTGAARWQAGGGFANLEVHGHHAPIFGAVCVAAGMGRLSSQRAYLFVTLRDLLSAATRLNVIGPLEAAMLHRRLSANAEEILSRNADRGVESACQTSPLQELGQGAHDLLFSRLFSS